MSNGFNNIAELKAANEAKGHTWFSNESTDYHGTVTETEVIGGFYFVESSNLNLGEPESGRVFRAVGASPDGVVQYLKGGDKFATLEEAVAYIDGVIADR
ncbi:hypothetical protein [Rhodococcus qingshengii]|uniref:hypothetical protein n=1 Tax=Rhodococcus qingshengii TaxID=334542 RepID=UPI00287FA8DA|nr:hypothetical protein [Rhodococcus qingshengii]